MRLLEDKQHEMCLAYLNEEFARGDEIKEVIEQMERHAASRGWREDKYA